MLTGIIIAVVVSLIVGGIKAILNASASNSNQKLNQVNTSVLYELPNDFNGLNNLPMYITKNNQQSGPYPPEQVLAWLNSGQISPFDMAIRQGEQKWQPLNMYFTARQKY